MEQVLIYAQVVIAILFILSVLLQEKGSAMSLTFGGGDSGNTFYGSKQGVDKFLAYASYLFGALFLLNALAYIIIAK